MLFGTSRTGKGCKTLNLVKRSFPRGATFLRAKKLYRLKQRRIQFQLDYFLFQ